MSVSIQGMLVVDKPPGVTSHDVVALVRRRLRCRAGHTGTLDPQATGVLLVCLGPATRLARFLQHRDKLYECGVRFGWATDTYDSDGEAVADPVPLPELTAELVQPVLDGFVGEIHQVPPVFSAKKIRGQPAYKRARRGETVVHEPVRVTIYSIELLAIEPERLRLRVHCGSGTYVRTLAHDLGTALGCPSHLDSLRRLRVASFELDDAIEWEEISEADPEDLVARVVPAAEMLPDWPQVELGADGVDVVRNGGVIEPRHVVSRTAITDRAAATPGTWVRLLEPGGRMIAAAEFLPGGMLQPRVVLP